MFELVNLDFSGRGTRFRLFPQPPILPGFREPETVWISLPPHSIGPGPADDRFYVANAVNKRRHYEYPYLPPYRDAVHAAVRPGPGGHFDHLEPDSPQFMAAHVYGTLRLVLDIWEGYFGRPIQWHFSNDYPRLELVPWVEWNNAQSGWGFIETGYRVTEQGTRVPLGLNFDVLAHELGHTILYSEIGIPPEGQVTAEYVAFHESASDLVAIVAALHFHTIVDMLLRNTSGNLYVRNLLNRIGETSPTEQIRLASNLLKMADVPDLRTPVEQLSQPERHRMGEPLTGAVFDVLVEIFQQNLVDARLISSDLDERSRRESIEPTAFDAIQYEFDRAFRANPDGFAQALIDARDYMGVALARTWNRLNWNLSFIDVGRCLLLADAEMSGGWYQQEILQAFSWREIAGLSPARIQNSRAGR